MVNFRIKLDKILISDNSLSNSKKKKSYKQILLILSQVFFYNIGDK